MENFITRYRNVTILVAILFAQVLGLAVQVKRNSENEPTRLIRIWTVNAVTPLEKSLVWLQNSSASLWHNYLYLRGVRQENRDLKTEIERLRVERVRLRDDAEQARRLQVLLGFKEQFISQTKAAQVIGSSGSEQSRSVYIDKGARDGIAPDMPVITADGVVGKVLRVFGYKAFEASTSQVLLINDQTSGVGVILEKSRLQGILRGTPSGEAVLEKVMADEQVQPGENVLTSGGDLVFPKGMPVGTVMNVSKGQEAFLNIRIKTAANLSKLEEVLVITKKEEKAPSLAESGPLRAVDILAQRLPSVPEKPPQDPNQPPPPTSGLTIVPAPVKPGSPAPAGTTVQKPLQSGATTAAPSATPKPKPQGNGVATTPPLPTTTSPKPQVNPAAPAAGKSGSVAPGTAIVKPATGQKPAPPPVKVSEKNTSPAGGQTSPQPEKPKAQPGQAVSQPPAEDKPH